MARTPVISRDAWTEALAQIEDPTDDQTAKTALDLARHWNCTRSIAERRALRMVAAGLATTTRKRGGYLNRAIRAYRLKGNP